MAVGSETWRIEHAALRAADARIFVSEAVRSYLEESHALDLRANSLIVPQAYAHRVITPPRPKLSADDGRTHMALVGTASDRREHGRWYGDIIERLVSLGLVVHSHFHELENVLLEPYRDLATRLDDYHFHPAVKDDRRSTRLSSVLSRYDLMGVFHELHAPQNNEAACLAMCLPCKAVCGWVHGGIPAVCFSHYAGVVEWIRRFGIGFVIEEWEDLVRVTSDRHAIRNATYRCLESRHVFTTEHNAERIHAFVEARLDRGGEKRVCGDLVQRL
jgi:hypothetical protein